MAENGTARGTLTPKQQRAIVALLNTKSVAEAASEAKVGARTLWRWLGEPLFRTYLSGAEADLLDAATRRLLQLQGKALETVEAILLDETAKPDTRLRAAQTVLDHLLKLRELRNVEQRLTALEAAYAQSAK